MEIHLAKIRERLSIDARHLPDAVIVDKAQSLLNQFLAENAGGQSIWDGLPGTFHALLTLDLEALADTPQRLTRRQASVPRPLKTQQAVHGTPITRNPLCQDPLGAMKGGSFCVSFWKRSHVEDVIPLLGQDSILLLDNGAYTVWKINIKRRKKKKPEIRMDAAYWDRFYDWAIGIAERVPQAVIVVPDVVEGSWIDNMALVEQIPAELNPDRCMPVWHLHEPLEYLEWLITGFGNIAFGSSGLYRTPGSTAWRRRVSQALEYIESLCADPARGQFYPRIHMMRGLGEMPEGEFPFASTDSTNIAQNHCVRLRDYGEDIADFRRRIEASRFPDPPFARWPLPSYAPHRREIVPRTRPIQFDIFDAA